jgi:hypothetical protein
MGAAGAKEKLPLAFGCDLCLSENWCEPFEQKPNYKYIEILRW